MGLLQGGIVSAWAHAQYSLRGLRNNPGEPDARKAEPFTRRKFNLVVNRAATPTPLPKTCAKANLVFGRGGGG